MGGTRVIQGSRARSMPDDPRSNLQQKKEANFINHIKGVRWKSWPMKRPIVPKNLGFS